MFKKGLFLDFSNHDENKNFKMSFYAESLVGTIPHEIIILYNYSRSLGSDDKPNYSYIFNQFQDFFTKNYTEEEEFEYDWIKKINMKKSKSSSDSLLGN